MTTRSEPLDAPALLEATRQALAKVSDGLDTSAVQPETPLAALVFDSLMAVNFISTLEAILGMHDLAFERWLAEHSERTDALTVGSLIDWLGSVPGIGPREAESVHSEPSGGPSENG